MKQILSLFVAGALGGLTVLGVSTLNKEDTTTFQPLPAKFASHTSAPVGDVSFVTASEKATDVVVHIFASESDALAQQRYQKQRRNFSSPFDDFFGGNFFGQGYRSPQNGSGSGVIISEDGYIVTNNHVVGFADNIKVTLNDGRKVNARKIGTDPSTDLAVIKIDLDEKLPTLKYSDSDQVKIGEWVLAVGNPFSYLTSTVTAGIISAKGRDLDIIDADKKIEEFIQTDAVVNPGNSGGALVNTKGELVGINTAIATPTGVYAGYSFAIPANVVRRIVRDIIENGDIERTNLGVLGFDINREVKKEFNLFTDDGFYIDSVQRGSAAQLAGVLPGDVIIGLQGKKVKEFRDIKELMKFNKVGDRLKLKILRKKDAKTVYVTLKKNK